jgi:hypothetical protein
MTDSCTPSADRRSTRCPGCASQGHAVAIETVRALVTISLRSLELDGYRFCPTLTCLIVYYGGENGPPITVDLLRELVYQKAADQDQVLICYCFQHSVGMLRRGDAVQRAAILADIMAGTRQGQCACDLRNPQGSCCLGNVCALMRQVPQKVSA